MLRETLMKSKKISHSTVCHCYIIKKWLFAAASEIKINIVGNYTIRVLNFYLVDFQGYYCLENSTTYMSTPCVVGHYCPEGTETADQFPCDKGYYNNYTTKGSVDDCIPCNPGYYCPTSGQEVKDYNLESPGT